jgi:hypothetical protein
MSFNRIRSNQWRRITPLVRRGHAAQRGTAQLKFSSRQTANIHLSALEFSPAKNADSLVVERIPTPERIAYAQDREPIIEIEMGYHMQGAVCPSH